MHLLCEEGEGVRQFDIGGGSFDGGGFVADLCTGMGIEGFELAGASFEPDNNEGLGRSRRSGGSNRFGIFSTGEVLCHAGEPTGTAEHACRAKPGAAIHAEGAILMGCAAAVVTEKSKGIHGDGVLVIPGKFGAIEERPVEVFDSLSALTTFEAAELLGEVLGFFVRRKACEDC